MTATQHAEAFVARTLPFEDLHEEYAHSEIFIEDLHQSIWQSMRELWGAMDKANLYDFDFHATFLLKLQGWDVSAKPNQQVASQQRYARQLSATRRPS